MNEYQERVIVEREELSIKLEKLIEFMHSDYYSSLGAIDQGLLMVQNVAMTMYLDTLDRRIELFN